MNKTEILQKCTVDGNIVRLPEGQLDRKLYQEVAKALELIGGKWVGRKTMGFVFPNDPTELLEQIANGESRNLKKEFQFFATPDDVADRMVELAEIDENAGQWILEPSAGQGSIINAINRKYPDLNVDYFELMDVNRTFLEKIPTARHLGDDFLAVDWKSGPTLFDRIIANPPFSKNQDIDHIRKMYECLNDGGRIVTIASTHWQISNNKKETEFRNWLEEINAEIHEIPKGTFKESGTMVSSVLIVIDK
jgi:type I restriction-modification system DNA methylase subunit